MGMVRSFSPAAVVLIGISVVYCSPAGNELPREGELRQVAVSYGSDTILLAAGLTGRFLERRPAPEGLKELPESWVQLTTLVKNLSRDTLRLVYGAPPCMLTVRLRAPREPFGDGGLRRVTPGGCLDLLRFSSLVPGGQDTIVSIYTADAMLGDSLQPGGYSINAEFEFDLERYTGSGWETLVRDTAVTLVLENVQIPQRR